MPALTAQNLKPSSPTWPRLLQPPEPHDTPSPRSPLLQFKGAVSFWVSWPRCRSLKSFPHLTVRKAQEGSFSSNAYIAWRLPLFEAFLEVLESRVESFERHLGGFTPSSRESDGCYCGSTTCETKAHCLHARFLWYSAFSSAGFHSKLSLGSLNDIACKTNS